MTTSMARRVGPGRPARVPGAKMVRLLIHVTAEERDVFRAAAQLRGVSGCDLFRVQMLGLAYDDLEHARQMQLRFGRPGGDRQRQLPVALERRRAQDRRRPDPSAPRTSHPELTAPAATGASLASNTNPSTTTRKMDDAGGFVEAFIDEPDSRFRGCFSRLSGTRTLPQ